MRTQLLVLAPLAAGMLTATSAAQQCCTGSVSTYCTAGTSVQGCVPSIAGVGQPNIAMPDGFDIVVSSVPGQRYGTIFYGFYSFITPWAPGSPSFKCVANPVQRMGNIPTVGTFGQCDGELLLDFNGWMTNNPTSLGSPFAQGQTIRAQGWYRDPAAPGQTNLSNAITFTLCSGPIDSTPPVITTCAANLTIQAGPSTCIGTVPDLRGQVVASDNCSGVTVTQVPPPGTPAALGTMPIVLRVRDAAGNATTCAAVLTVQDATAPVISTCASDQASPANGNCSAPVPDFTASVSAVDQCSGIASIQQVPPAGTMVAVGLTPILITVTDSAGNSTLCAANFTVSFSAQCAPQGFVYIQPGSFQMGSNAASGYPYHNDVGVSPQPPHAVTISYPFWMGAHEVTQGEFAALMGTNPSYFSGDPNRPVDGVSWFLARGYCATITAQNVAIGLVPTGYQYRLPTEAEWEFACRAGSSTEFGVGAALYCADAKFRYSYHSNSACFQWGGVGMGTAPVGSYAPNGWGLYDMHGNVMEWCLESSSTYPAGSVVDPYSLPTGWTRVLRGGSWDHESSYARSAFRYEADATASFNRFGFRVVLAPILPH